MDAEDSRKHMMRQHIGSIAELAPRYFWHDHRYCLVEKLLPTHATSLLDYGCGDGGFLAKLRDRDGQMTLSGFDLHITPSGRQKSADLAKKSIIFLNQDPVSQERTYDVITLLDVLEHVDDDKDLLIRLKNILAQNAVLIITVPAMQLLWSDWDRMLGHFRRYERKSLIWLLEECGYKVDYSSYFFSYLIPPAVMRRFSLPPQDTPLSGDRQPEFPKISRMTNALLLMAGYLERLILPAISLPWGTSLIAVASRRSR